MNNIDQENNMDLINQENGQAAVVDDDDYDLGDAPGGSKKRKLRRLALQDDD